MLDNKSFQIFEGLEHQPIAIHLLEASLRNNQIEKETK